MGDEEVVLGDFVAFAKLTMGSEKLRLFFTTRRIIVARVGRRGSGGGFSFLGKMGRGLEDLFKSGREAAVKGGLEKLSPQSILEADKDNFSIGYDEVISVEAKRSTGLTKMTVLTRQDKFELSTTSNKDVLGLLDKTLHDKLTLVEEAEVEPVGFSSKRPD